MFDSKITTYVPTPDGSVRSEVLAAIDGDVEVLRCRFDGAEFSKRQRVAKTREKIMAAAQADKCDFAVIHDSDLVDITEHNVKRMFLFLVGNPKCGAVSLRRVKTQIPGHICSGVVMFRAEAMPVVKFGIFQELPTCYSILKSLSDHGLRYQYLDSVRRIKYAGSN